VYLAKAQAKGIQTVIDTSSSTSDKGKYYDVIGFDPRGIANTEPAARCMPDGPSSWSWRLRETTEGMLGSSDAALGRLWSMTHAFGTSCKQAMDAEEGPDIKQYMSTASVARDMLEIAEKHANWVTDKAKGLSVSKDVSEASSVKLQYWGFSYGTYLGATFASMFPDRVGRLVLDGVVNVQDYNNALGQGSLHDSEKDMKSFYTFCHGSGPELCPLTTSTSNVQNIEQRVQKIIKSLYHNPLMITTADHGPDIFTYTDLKSAIFSSLYTPAYAFQFVADILAAVENRGGPIFDQFARSYIDTHIYQCPIGNSSQPVFWDTDIPQSAILCGDGIDQSTTDIERFDAYWQTLQDISPSVGPIWAMLKMKCAAWHIKPKYRLGGDEKFHGHTSQPILWVSNTADPVTPLRSARLMQDRFPGSGLLVQDSAGHCSSSTPTPCTIKHIKEYFQTGALPDPQIVCAPPISPFSLNSTDPDSPFYDPSLGQALFLTEEGLEDEMYAAKQLQSWAADHDFLGRSLAGQRVKGLMRSLSMHGSAMMDGLDDLGI
jgi:pimeloyl-ACP methyl ester carboxylesterase